MDLIFAPLARVYCADCDSMLVVFAGSQRQGKKWKSGLENVRFVGLTPWDGPLVEYTHLFMNLSTLLCVYSHDEYY